MNPDGTDYHCDPLPGPATSFAAGPVATPVPAVGRQRSVEESLYAEGYRFDFFQAVRLLERLAPTRRSVGRQGTVAGEIVRFRVPASLAFPASSILRITPATERQPTIDMWVQFLGLTGPSGVLPRHYTEMLIRRHIDIRGAERYVLRDWLDLFNHRLISLFYRAWEKYRFWLAYERGEYQRTAPDTFTACLRGLIGLAPPSLHNRLTVAPGATAARSHTLLGTPAAGRSNQLARIDDIHLMRYAGLLGQSRRSAVGLQAMLADYFQVPVRVLQFQGQWLQLESDDQLQLGKEMPTARLGNGAVVGPRVWNVQGKFRICLGPLDYQRFCDFFPDPAPTSARKSLFLLSQLVRLYAGPAFDFDVQLILRRHHTPRITLASSGRIGARLGWNTWLCTTPPAHDPRDAVIAGQLHCPADTRQEVDRQDRELNTSQACALAVREQRNIMN